jgi:rod shape-determining protein MreC
MENFFVRYKNPLVLMLVVIIQVVVLATQVKRPENAKNSTAGGGPRLIRVWSVTAFTPIEKAFVSTGHFFRNGWHNYADLRGIRKQNRDLQARVEQLQMDQVQLRQDADQARRLQVLLDFKEKYISKTVAAQVIGTSGTEQSRVIIIDKGSRDGIKQDMAVITPDGIVGKIKDVFPLSSQVLLINDRDSGAGVILEHSRLQGIVKGTSFGELQVNDIMSDETVDVGEHVITSGGDRIYPKGFSVGTVTGALPDRDNDTFLAIKIKPSADLMRLEEVLVVTKLSDSETSVASGPTPMRAADILAERLPSIPKQDDASKAPGAKSSKGAAAGAKPTATPAAKAPAVPAKTVTPSAAGAGQKSNSVTGTTTTKPATSGQISAASSASPSPTPTPAKPKAAAPRKPKAPMATPDGTATGTTEPKTTDNSGSSAPAATPTATPEKPQR